MNKWLKRLSNWFFQIENEVMIPFVLVGILVIGSFSVISYYNGYTMQKNSEMELADTLFEDVNRDLHFLEKRLPEEEIAEKYRNFERGGSGFWIVTVRRSRLEPVGKIDIGTGSQQGGQVHLAWRLGVPDE